MMTSRDESIACGAWLFRHLLTDIQSNNLRRSLQIWYRNALQIDLKRRHDVVKHLEEERSQFLTEQVSETNE